MTGALQGFYQNFRSFAVAAVEAVATGNKVIFGYGGTAADLSITNLVSNTGVVASDTAGVGTARYYLAAASFA